jgi:hypothetical protein
MSAEDNISNNNDEREEQSRVSVASSRGSVSPRSLPIHDPDRRSLSPPERDSARHMVSKGANVAHLTEVSQHMISLLAYMKSHGREDTIIDHECQKSQTIIISRLVLRPNISVMRK